MRIAFNRKDYPEKRCIINKVENVEYIHLPNKIEIKLLVRFEAKIFKRMSKYQFRYLAKNINKIDGYHFFNDISKSNIKYITTFETFLPRINQLSEIHHYKEIKIEEEKEVRKNIEILGKSQCKKIIALSKCNYEMQKMLLLSYGELGKKVLNKMIQINPPQDMIIKNYEEKIFNEEKIKFIFIGGDFVRKGGVEIVQAFQQILMEKNKLTKLIELTIVSDVNRCENYVFKNFQDNESELSEIKNIIESSDWIKHYSKIDNKSVLELMKESHIGLLPTWGDTYGYSVLEFQACGCPVVTTNVRALKEINNSKCGWLITIPTNKLGEMAIENNVEKIQFRSSIINQLKTIIYEIIENKEIIREKGVCSLERIKNEHCPQKYSEKMKEIYEKVF